jgi:hypothetical protein
MKNAYWFLSLLRKTKTIALSKFYIVLILLPYLPEDICPMQLTLMLFSKWNIQVFKKVASYYCHQWLSLKEHNSSQLSVEWMTFKAYIHMSWESIECQLY